MDAYPPPPQTDAAEGETGTEGRKMKPWSKPVIRHIGQTIYTATGANEKTGEGENYSYMTPTS